MKNLIFSLLFLSSALLANNYNKGVDAYKTGHYKKAVELWKPYAAEGNVKAQYSIATIFYEGKGVEQNYRKALYWYKQAAQQEHAKSFLRIGMMYCKGEGVLKSFKEAVPYVKMAFDAGCTKAPEVWSKYELWKYE